MTEELKKITKLSRGDRYVSPRIGIYPHTTVMSTATKSFNAEQYFKEREKKKHLKVLSWPEKNISALPNLKEQIYHFNIP